jgi:hypothetical protein
MRLVITLAAITLLVIPSIAEAQQQRQRGGGYAPQSRGYVQRNYRPNNNYNRGGNYYRNNGNRYVQNNYYGGRGYRGGGGWNNGWNNGGAIAAGVGLGLLGGLIGGALINQPAYAAPAYAYPPPAYGPGYQGCVRQVVGYSQSTGQTITQLVCP